MSAPAFGSIGTHLLGSSGTASFAVPASVAANDVIVIPMFIDVGARVLSGLAAGFVHAEGSPIVGASNSLAVVWKRASGADAGTYDFTLDSSTYRAGSAIRYTGCITTGSPFDSPVGTAFEDINGTVTPSVAVTTAGPDRLLAFYATNWSGGGWTPPGSFTERLDTGDQVLTADDLVQAVAGSSGGVTATCVGNDKRIAALYALIGTTPATPAAGSSFYVRIPPALVEMFAVARSLAFQPGRIGATVTGTAVAALGASAGTVVGTPTVLGVAPAPLGGAAAAALGTPVTVEHGEARPTPPLPLLREFVIARAAAFQESRTAATVTGVAVASLGGIAAVAAATPTVTGVAAAALGRLTGTAVVGSAAVTGTGSATLGRVTATSAGLPTVLGTAAAPLGRATAAASGTPTVPALAPAPLGALVAAAVGWRTTFGAASASLGGVAAAAGVAGAGTSRPRLVSSTRPGRITTTGRSQRIETSTGGQR